MAFKMKRFILICLFSFLSMAAINPKEEIVLQSCDKLVSNILMDPDITIARTAFKKYRDATLYYLKVKDVSPSVQILLVLIALDGRPPIKVYDTLVERIGVIDCKHIDGREMRIDLSWIKPRPAMNGEL